MTDRDTFAAAALIGNLARTFAPAPDMAESAYRIADAMLAEREKPQSTSADRAGGVSERRKSKCCAPQDLLTKAERDAVAFASERLLSSYVEEREIALTLRGILDRLQ